MRQLQNIFLVFVSISLLFSTNVKSVHAIEDWFNNLEKIIEEEQGLVGATFGISVRSAKTGKPIFDYDGNRRLKPASNMKLFTAAAALSNLGETYQFKTELKTNGSINWNWLHGDLYIIGKGDPTLQKKDIDEMVIQLKDKGVRVISGNLIADDTWYDSIRYPVDLPWSDETMSYGSQISALTFSADQDFNTGNILIEVSPGSLDKVGLVQTFPQSEDITIINLTKTVRARDKKNVRIERIHGKSDIVVKGSIPMQACKEIFLLPVWEPTKHTISLFKQSLKEQNIRLLGDILFEEAPVATSTITSHLSIPLSELLIPFMKYSNNNHAEVLVKEMGKHTLLDGSWHSGLIVLKNELAKLGLKNETLIIRDGSGISHVNLITPNQVTRLLYEVQKEQWFETFLKSLPISGSSTKLEAGTFGQRFTHIPIGKLSAKTGTLSTVSSLSGYVEKEKGESLIFSIMINNLGEGINAKEIEDKIVAALIEQ